ncbi:MULTISPECIES: hypothetical protein [unclassified Mesorhizobium]|uniref:hypothetical protein n=1 Tax=unclassified Mesorhizobium TaxID=325217 RepID=UPI000FCACF5F|nr:MULTISPECIES: hypothetical protein [unclassified Mesorhizobium]RUU27350.1 hypothetical protein EOC94_22860 [Mesorhizobium sp. M6A.T.Ce.TU.016.01.1.1]RVB77514.1 hypothetical protein EN885_12265 [Mesorhizobium sp. M6A.T.Cr.TU.014.01.1.1]RWP45708.1 MAG: hypothetical protein EOR05_23210 [Mesorhizobium sp.]RWP49092.1 MAG: hypothetical protein EOR06_25755 [Mesorhizobium sp.]RWP71733.1 MAG: hypothetical protein EOR10_29260 [Mesorhizobium sp.]
MPADAKARTVVPGPYAGVAMDMMNSFGKIAAPTLPRTDFNYETECKKALAPLVDGLLDAVESAGWDRRKAAYTLMFLSAQRLGAGKGGRDDCGADA